MNSYVGERRYVRCSGHSCRLVHSPRQEDEMNASEIAYGGDPLQKIKIFNFSPENSHTIVFIHGGAWRDPNNTYLDFNELVGHLLKKYNLIGINYRLSPEHKHPDHLVDVVTAIAKIQAIVGSHSDYSFVGHSVGATLLLQLLNYQDIITLGHAGHDESHENAICSLPKLLLNIHSIFFVDGIYDIKDLIAEYGAPYKGFVDSAFQDEKYYLEASQMTWSLSKTFDYAFRPVIIQSTQDELLTSRQSEAFFEFLKKRDIPVECLSGDWGKHEEVYRRRELAEIIEKRLENARVV